MSLIEIHDLIGSPSPRQYFRGSCALIESAYEPKDTETHITWVDDLFKRHRVYQLDAAKLSLF